MQLLCVSYSRPKPSRYFIDGRRVSKDRYWDTIDAHRIAGRDQNSFMTRTKYDAHGHATQRRYSCITGA